MVTCLEWPQISPTLLQKWLRDSPSIQGVERGFVQGGSLPLLCYCSLSCRQTLPNFGSSPWPDWQWDLTALFGDCCPTVLLSGPGNPKLVAPLGGEPRGPKRGPKEGAHQTGENGHFSSHISGWGCGVGMRLLVRWGPVCPTLYQKDECLLPRLSGLLGEKANPNPFSGGLGLAHAS